MVGAEGLRRRARRRPRQRQVAGQCEPWSLAEAIDFYDAIEWAAAQPWCNGKVGLSGISYFAINQWFVANLQPPSLKAIIPWEGFADIYRDALFHGGILSVFMTNWFTAHLMHHVMGRAAQHQPDGWQTNTLWHWLHNNLDSGALARRAGAVGQDHGADAHGRQLDRLRAASARQHRGVYARRLQAQEAPHPQRLARASVLHRRGQARSAPLLRLLAQGHRQRRDGRAAGQARDPQGQGRDRMARRARMAARAHAMDQVLFRHLGGGLRPGAARGQPGAGEAGQGQFVHLSGVQPRHHGLDLGGVVAGDGRRHQARHGHRAVDAADGPRTPRSPGRSPRRSMCRARARTWTCS